jgi:hypothetical protein
MPPSLSGASGASGAPGASGASVASLAPADGPKMMVLLGCAGPSKWFYHPYLRHIISHSP